MTGHLNLRLLLRECLLAQHMDAQLLTDFHLHILIAGK